METKYSLLTKKLSKREIEIAIFIAGEETYKAFAPKLYITPGTARCHAKNIFRKIQIEDRKEFREKYPRIKEYFTCITDPDREYGGLKNVKTIDFESNNHNFQNYDLEFSNVIRSMYLRDFTQMLPERGEPTDFLHFIATGLNEVNRELDKKYLDQDSLTDILDSFGLKNRVLILSKNGMTVSHVSILSEEVFVNSDDIIGKRITDLFLDYENTNGQNLSVKLNPKFFVSHQEQNALLEIKKIERFTIYALTIHPEHVFKNLIPRILTLISTIRDECMDSPELYNSVIGNTISYEANDLYRLLKAYILLYKR